MRNKLVATLCISLSFFVSSVHAEEGATFSTDVTAAVYSDYMFRGFKSYEGTSIQPSITFNADTGDTGKFSLGAWSHLSGNSSPSSEKFTEVDYTAKYTLSGEDYAFSVGHIWYQYPTDNVGFVESTEFFVSLALNSAFTPVLTAYRDYDEFQYEYYELGFSHAFSELVENAIITPYVTFAFATNAERVYSKDGLIHTTLGTSLSVPLGSGTLVPSINYTAKGDSILKNNVWFGTAFNLSF